MNNNLIKIKNLTKNFINNKLVVKVLKNLKKPIYFISGNHEYYIKNYQEKLGKLNEYSINFLDNKSIKYKNINIIGVSDNQSTLNQTETVNLSLIHI